MTSEHVRDAWAQLDRAGRQVITPPTGAVVSLLDIKQHVGQPLADDDYQLESLALAAVTQVEAFTGRAVVAQTRRVWFDAAAPVLILPEPVTAVTEVKTFTLQDVEEIVSPVVYQLDEGRKRPRVRLRSGEVWPSGLRTMQAVAVTYTAGWAPVAVPYAIRLAVLYLVADWYAAPVLATGTAAGMRPGLDALLMPYRVRTGVA